MATPKVPRSIVVRFDVQAPADLTTADLRDVIAWHCNVDGPDGGLHLDDIADPSAVTMERVTVVRGITRRVTE